MPVFSTRRERVSSCFQCSELFGHGMHRRPYSNFILKMIIDNHPHNSRNYAGENPRAVLLIFFSTLALVPALTSKLAATHETDSIAHNRSETPLQYRRFSPPFENRSWLLMPIFPQHSRNGVRLGQIKKQNSRYENQYCDNFRNKTRLLRLPFRYRPFKATCNCLGALDRRMDHSGTPTSAADVKHSYNPIITPD